MKQRILALVECLLELEDLAQVADMSETDLKDLDCATREFARLFRSLVMEVIHEKK